MKTLAESLFDQEKNIKKDIFAFGDFFELDGYETQLTRPGSRGYFKDEQYKLSDLYNKQLISKDSKVKGDPDEVIVNGLTKIIQGMKVTSQTEHVGFQFELERLQKYYKSIMSSSTRFRAQSRIWCCAVDPDDPTNRYIERDYKIIDQPGIEIHLCRLTLKFKRK